VVADALEPADEHAEPGRVQEVDLLQVDDDVVGAVADQLDQLLAQLWRGVDVDLTGHLEHRVVVILAHVEVEIHPLLQSRGWGRATIGCRGASEQRQGGLVAYAAPGKPPPENW
jgi:hypothetical protein